MSRHVVVVGGGLAGLTCAYRVAAARPDWRVTVVEEERSTGGKVRSDRLDGFTVDWGPNGFVSAPQTLRLAADLGLEGDLVPAAEAARRRYLFRHGGLRPLPLSPPAFLGSDLISIPGKLRAASEVLLGRARPREESVFEFVARHFGLETARVFGEVLVAGVAAGDPHTLSVDALFPRLRALERAHGSLLRGLLAAQRRGGGGGAGLTTFRGGMGRLSDALTRALGEAPGARVRCGVGALALARRRGGGFELTLASGERLDADAVVLSVPAFVSARLLREVLPEAVAALRAIPYADVWTFGLGYARVDVPRLLDGFGFLAPRGEGVRSLGVLWSSAAFPEQAPDGAVTLRVIAGGSLDPDFIGLSEADALAEVRRDLERSMGIRAEPLLATSRAWPRGIPQYTLAHGARVDRIMRAVADVPGLHLDGNAYRGVGVNDTIEAATRTAEALLGEGAG